MKAFITGTGTAVGKTHLTAALARHLHREGRRVVALKPIETGLTVDADRRVAEDATRLAAACGRPELADHPGFHRVVPPRSPYAAEREGAAACPALPVLVQAVAEASAGAEDTLVEAAGGLFVPLTSTLDTADLATALAMPLLLVAPDRLGVQSDVTAYALAARMRGLTLAAVVLNAVDDDDGTREGNAVILRERLGLPIVAIPHGEPAAEALRSILDAAGYPS